ncbi:DUF1349 domain-containing protein [Microbacterium sp. SS28]|uniref:DUF1349 domain-containing protein n=1 Tax=Microbacterium sp. SS28 TaxID=2919948 RepID=UPI001FAA3B22|nr:DUF1349 domain-containing protein [Microbacterium sp. SS28]
MGEIAVEDGAILLTAAPGVDWTNDATGAAPFHTATSLSFAPPRPFQLSARVSVGGQRTTFDAAALTLWADEDHWAKLCFEYSPHGEEMVVSVVTDRYSDDSNGPVITGGEVWLRVSSVGDAYAYHYSVDGSEWHFVRLFRLDSPAPLRLGIMSQAPMGDVAVARFTDLRLVTEQLADVRDGR